MSDKISCDICNTQVKDSKEYGVHIREQHNKFYCGPCRQEMQSEQELKDHLKNAHSIDAENNL